MWCDELQKVLRAKVFECKSFDAKATDAEIAATLKLLLRGPLRKNEYYSATYFLLRRSVLLFRPPSRKGALLSDYLFMDVPAHSGDSSIGDLLKLVGPFHCWFSDAPMSRLPDVPIPRSSADLTLSPNPLK